MTPRSHVLQKIVLVEGGKARVKAHEVVGEHLPHERVVRRDGGPLGRCHGAKQGVNEHGSVIRLIVGALLLSPAGLVRHSPQVLSSWRTGPVGYPLVHPRAKVRIVGTEKGGRHILENGKDITIPGFGCQGQLQKQVSSSDKRQNSLRVGSVLYSLHNLGGFGRGPLAQVLEDLAVGRLAGDGLGKLSFECLGMCLGCGARRVHAVDGGGDTGATRRPGRIALEALGVSALICGAGVVQLTFTLRFRHVSHAAVECDFRRGNAALPFGKGKGGGGPSSWAGRRGRVAKGASGRALGLCTWCCMAAGAETSCVVQVRQAPTRAPHGAPRQLVLAGGKVSELVRPGGRRIDLMFFPLGRPPPWPGCWVWPGESAGQDLAPNGLDHEIDKGSTSLGLVAAQECHIRPSTQRPARRDSACR